MREETDLPGLAVALVEGSDDPLLAAAGYADTERMIPITGSSTSDWA